jgi:hypothetical protein
MISAAGEIHARRRLSKSNHHDCEILAEKQQSPQDVNASGEMCEELVTMWRARVVYRKSHSQRPVSGSDRPVPLAMSQIRFDLPNRCHYAIRDRAFSKSKDCAEPDCCVWDSLRLRYGRMNLSSLQWWAGAGPEWKERSQSAGP